MLIHRDIKPENILLGRRNEILLSDFGIALVAQSSRYQSAQEMAGTMAYMAPEQIQGKPRPASDQYSLGIVVYEWLSGDRPFHGSLTELVGQHLSVPPPSLQEKVSTISSEVEQVVLTALAKDPKQRFASIQVFATVLEQAYHSSQHYPPAPSVVASPPSQSPLPNIIAPSLSQSSLPTNAVEAILPDPSPLPTNTVFPLSHSPQSTNIVIPPTQSLQPTNVVTPSASLSQPTVAATPTHTPVVSPPSTEEPIPSGGPQPSKHRISRRAIVIGLAGLGGVSVAGGGIAWLAHSQRPQVSSLAHHPTAAPTSVPTPTPTATPAPQIGTILFTYRGHHTAVSAVAWSPNGKRIASGSYYPDGIVHVWDAITGNTTLTYYGHSQSQFGVLAVVWSPDGKYIASGGTDNTVQIWDATTGGNIYTYRSHHAIVDAVVWSPDARRIASGSEDKTVQVWLAS
jgi:eukaryotic-like serine/threonine-protein kinase